MQQLWELKVDWNDWCLKTSMMPGYNGGQNYTIYSSSQMPIPRCYFDKKSKPLSTESHGLSDASKLAYAAVVYLQTPLIVPTLLW